MKNKPFYLSQSDLCVLRDLNHNNIDLYLISCGIENCFPGHSAGPGSRDKFLIHIILSGKGQFISNNQTYHLHQNQAFIIYPNKTVFYQADFDEPWKYTWIGFNGVMAETYLKYAGITDKTDFINLPEECCIPDLIQKMLRASEFTFSNELLRQSLLLDLMSKLVSYNCANYETNPSYLNPYMIYTEQALHYISKEYMNGISVSKLAETIGITRSYLTKCFRSSIHLSPKQYIMKFRMERACELLHSSSLNITQIADAVGYSNSLTFSKAFKSYYGISPNEWRSKNVSF